VSPLTFIVLTEQHDKLKVCRTLEILLNGLASILGEEPKPLAQFNAETPAELQRNVSKALQKKRAGRSQTAKDILSDIRSLKQEWDYRARFESRQADDLSN
jgi:hypothetical protein